MLTKFFGKILVRIIGVKTERIILPKKDFDLFQIIYPKYCSGLKKKRGYYTVPPTASHATQDQALSILP